MKKTLPDEVFYFMMISPETEGTQRLKCHLQLHLGLGELSAIFDLHRATLFLKAYGKKKGRKEEREEGRKGGREVEGREGGREEEVGVIMK